MYNGQRTVVDLHHHGSTRLHLDLTDALNFMPWAEIRDGLPGFALWHIFLPSDTEKVAQFIIKYADLCGFGGIGHPIHTQQVYLTQNLLKLLFEACGVRPYQIKQYPGDVVQIPAGCLHQVSF